MKSKQILVSSLFLLTLGLIFWTGSRYPNLSEKALMGDGMPNMGLSFDLISTIDEDDSKLIKVYKHTINWIETNKKGMTFGILFASCLLLLFNLLKEKQFKNRFLNSFLGLLIGAPLGVCVNCATPIGKGIYDAGGRTETALSTMMSSPTFNFIILTMLFSLFPVYMIAIKLTITAGIILVAIPIIVHWFEPKRQIELVRVQDESFKNFSMFNESPMLSNTWLDSLKWFGKNYLKSLWFIVKTTLPLMLLAGFLGNLLITFIPIEELIYYLPRPGSKFQMVLVAIAMASFAVLLPVPMAFDLIIVAILMSTGMPVFYCTILLVTLGAFSLYPFFIIYKDISKKIALAVLVAVILGGAFGGIVAHYAQKKISTIETINHLNDLNNLEDKSTWLLNSSDSINNIPEQINIGPAVVTPLEAYNKSSYGNISILKMPYNKSSQNGSGWMQELNGDQIGLFSPYKYSSKHLYIPKTHQRNISIDDLNNDGYPDLVATSADTVYHYINKMGSGFELIKSKNYINEIELAILVDFDNDGDNDLFLTTFFDGNYIIENVDGVFENMFQVGEDKKLFTVAPGFSDFNKDGKLDMFWGNFYHPRANGTTSTHSQNIGMMQSDINNWKRFDLASDNGETLSILLSDINMDGYTDIIEGNDFAQSDFYHLGTQDSFQLVTSQDSLIEISTHTTMSIISADIDNDLFPELYLDATNSAGAEKTQDISVICSNIKNPEEYELCKQVVQHKTTIARAQKRKDYSLIPYYDLLAGSCYVFSVKLIGVAGDRREENMPKNVPFFSDYVLDFNMDDHKIIVQDSLYFADKIKGKRSKGQNSGNAVLLKNQDGSFYDRSEEFNVTNSGWAWNSKFADLDNDGWQDLFIVNGYNHRSVPYQNNILYKNQEGKRFENVTKDAGMDNFLPISTYGYADFDLDGDIDIVMAPQIGPLFFYQNNTNDSANSITFKFKDQIGNIAGIGNKVFIYYDGGQKHQYREMLFSGGFKGYDEHIAHFGLGESTSIDSLKVIWSTGETDVFNTEFEANARYLLERNSTN